jgi:serine/threonine-protein kinase
MSETLPESDDSPIVGTMLGNYRVTAELSRGGMGTVYVATHELIGRRAAVKVLRPELTANAELVTRFFNEAKAATAVHHPGIVEVFDFGYSKDGRAYLTMELLDGITLAARVEQRGRLTELEVAQLARGIAGALAAAHQAGIVHRDLKPDNVFLVADPDVPGGERPKLLDFGIAKLVDPVGLSPDHRATVTGALMGTPLYMAPEQARAAGEIDARADLYSLGCMMYEMLVGEPPFVAVGPGEIIALQLFGKVQPPSARLDRISREMEQLVMRLLEKEPDDRYATAHDVIDAIDRTLGSMSVRLSAEIDSERRPTLIGVGRQPKSTIEIVDEPIAAPKRSRAPYVLAAMAIAAAAAAIAIVVMAKSNPNEPATTNAPAPAQQQPPQPAPVAVPVPVPVPIAVPTNGSAAPPPTQTNPALRDPLSKHHAQPVRHPPQDTKHTDRGTPIESELPP